MQRVAAPYLTHFEGFAVFRNADVPFAGFVAPSIDEDFVFAHTRIVVAAAREILAQFDGLLHHGVRRPILLDAVHVVGHELAFGGQPGRLELPFEVGAADGEDLVSGGRTVRADVVLAELLGPPPRAADGGDVVFVDVGEGRGLHVAVYVGVSRDNVNRGVTVETAEQGRDGRRTVHGDIRRERGAVPPVGVDRAVEADDDGSRFVHVFQILPDPVQLLLGEILVVGPVADHARPAAVVEVDRIVEH